jgi:hypothetical protein
MTNRTLYLLIVLGGAVAALLNPLGAQTIPSLEKPAIQILVKNCTTAGCHAGAYPSMNLSLEAARIPGGLVGKPSMVVPERLIVDPVAPEKSYLLAKIKGEAGISGKQMPLGLPAISPADLKAIEDLVLSLRGARKIKSDSGNGEASETGEEGPAFWGLSLINLPTSETPELGRFYFRLSHRFYSTLRGGLDSLFGLDDPSAVWIGFGYGLTDRISLSLGRTNQAKELETAVRWKFLDQGDFPFEASLQAGLGWTTEKIADRKRADARHFKLNLQLSLVKRLTERLSVLVVPSLSTHTDYWAEDPENTFALGFGGRFLVFEGLSLIGEWTPVLAGYAAASNGWGFGMEKKIGGHVFQFFIANSFGLTPDLYLPGGDLRLGDGDLRLGFNIYRTF